jgi:hypothetical protein
MHQLAVRFSRDACPVNKAADILTHRCADVHPYSDANIHSNGSANVRSHNVAIVGAMEMCHVSAGLLFVHCVCPAPKRLHCMS